MQLDDQTIKDILLKGNYIKEADIATGEKIIATKRLTLLEYLLAQQIITYDLFGQAVAEYYGVPYQNLKYSPPPQDLVLKMPPEVAKKYHAILAADDGKTVTVATDNLPRRGELLNELKIVIPNRRAIVAYSLPEDIDSIFLFYRKTLETRFSKILKERKRPIPEIFEEIMRDALDFKSSDVHFDKYFNHK